MSWVRFQSQERHHIFNLFVECDSLEEEFKVDETPLHELCLTVHELLLADLWQLDRWVLSLHLTVTVLHVLIPSEDPMRGHLISSHLDDVYHLLRLPLTTNDLHIHIQLFRQAFRPSPFANRMIILISRRKRRHSHLHFLLDLLDFITDLGHSEIPHLSILTKENETLILTCHLNNVLVILEILFCIAF